MADRNAHIKISFDSDNTAYISGTSSSDITCTLSPDGYKLTFVFDSYILGGNYSNFGSYDATNSIFTLTKPIEFLTRSATGEIVNRGEVISVSPPSQENSYTYVATIEEISKTTLDLSTLSDITDGTHTVKVKAKADGYRDSEFSNEVSYTKAPAGQKITTLSINDSASWKDSWDIYIKFDGVASPTNYDARFKNDKSVSENRDRIYYNDVWSAKNTDVTVDITATQWSAYVAEQEYTNYVWPCADDSSFYKTVSPSTNGNLYPIGRDNNKFIVKQPAD